MWVINNSGGSLSYKAPDGTYESVANDTWDLWAGTTKIHNDIAALTAAQTLARFKILGGTATTSTFDFDNIVIDPIPAAPSAAPTFSSVGPSGFSVSWNAATGATGYRLDIDDNSDFSSPLAGYNDLAVAGTSQAVTGLNASTTYYARVRTENYAGTSNHSSSGNQATSAAATAPTGVTTGTAGSITASGATISTSNVTADGGSAITERGVVYATTSNPTTSNTKVTASGTTGTFDSTLTGLAASTTYYVRAYATNSVGTTYGSDVSFTTTAAAGPVLTAATLASALTATYPSASSGVSFTAAGTNLTENILVTAQTGYEVSTTEGSGYGASVSVASGTTVWIRFAASRNAGNYNSATAAILSSAGAANANVTTSSSGNTISNGTPPTLTANATATVDGAFTVTFADDATWRSNISSITVGGTTLTAGFSVGAGTITFTPSASSPANLLQTSGSKAIIVNATNYSATTSLSQTIAPGAAHNLSVTTQPAAPATNGAALATQPVVTIRDQYNNTATGSSASVTAAVGSGTWTLGGTAAVSASSGVATFSGLTATSAAAVTGATISFTSSGLTGATSSTFNIPAPDFISLTALDTAGTENFNSMAATLNLPPAWKMHASTSSPTWAGAGSTVTQAANSGGPTSGGTYNWGNTAGTDRAVGAMTSSTFSSPNNLLAKVRNNTGGTLTALSINFTVERYRVNTAAASVELYYSTDGSAWTLISGGNVTNSDLPTGTSAYDFAPGLTVSRSDVTQAGLSIANGADFYLRWNINTTGSSSQGIGIDDVSITAITPPSNPPVVTASTFAGTVGAAFNQSISATNIPTSYGLQSGTLPTGLSLNTVTGAITGTPTTAGDGTSVTINATNAAGTGSATITFNIAKGSQTITFGAQTTLGVGSTRAVGATASSGLTVTYSSSNTGVATISGTNVTGVAAGSTTITASQAGDANWNAATPVDQALSVAFLPTTWDFGTASPTNVPSGATVSDVTRDNNNGTTTLLDSTSPSSGYTGSSGSNNAGAAARVGALNTAANGSAYFQFSANATSGNYITFTGISLGVRSTSTGPTTISLRSDADSYASDIVTFTTSNGSTWQLVSNSTFSQVYEGNRTFRLYGHSGTGSATASTANWRIDDLALTLSVSAKTTPTVTVSVGSYTYDGAVKGPVSVDVSTGGSSGAITMSYVGTGGTSYGSSATRPTAAGTYTATASVAATTTHNAASSAATAFTISQRSVTGSFTANNKTYDGSNSATVSGTSLSNTIGGDTVSLTGGTATFSDAAAANGKTVTLAGASLTGASSANYTLGSVNTTTANITAASVTVTAGNQTKTFGASDPALTYTPSPALIAGNSFSGALSRAAGEGVGTYAISQGTLSAGSNYTITFVGANLTITQATPSITTAPTASTITSGQALSSSVLSGGVASVAGTFDFTTPATVPSPGISSQGVTFTPTDTGNYTTQTTSVNVGVLCLAPVLTRATLPESTGFTVNWAAVTGAANYTVLHSASKNMTGATSANTTSTSLALTGLSEGLRFVQVRANNAAGTGANSTTQVNQLQSIAAGATQYVSLASAPSAHTVAGIFGSANEAGLAAGATDSVATAILLLNSNGSTANTIFYDTDVNEWREGPTAMGTTAIAAGKAFILKNNTGSTDYFLLAGTPRDSQPVVSLSSAGNFTLLTTGRTSNTTLSDLNLNPGTGNGQFKAASKPSGGDRLIVPPAVSTDPVTTYWYHTGSGQWYDGLTPVPSASIPAGQGFFIKRAADSTFDSWTMPAE